MLNSSKLRLFLLGLGFNQPSSECVGLTYQLNIPNLRLFFTVSIKDRICKAFYPDKQYGKASPYTKKDIVVDFSFADIEDEDTVVENVKAFINKVTNTVKNQ